MSKLAYGIVPCGQAAELVAGLGTIINGATVAAISWRAACVSLPVRYDVADRAGSTKRIAISAILYTISRIGIP